MRNKAGTHPNVHEAIHRAPASWRIRRPAFTAEQMILLKAVFSHREGGGR